MQPKICSMLLVMMWGLLCFQARLTAQQLRHPNNQADYIIIVPPEFEQTIQSFAQWRASKGLRVKIVSITSIEQEFPLSSNVLLGLTSPRSEQIRRFVRYALENWQRPAPKYLLLAGAVTHVPLYLVPNCSELAVVPPRQDTLALDEVFGVEDGSVTSSSISSIMIGRFPARTQGELHSIIQKTRRFEDTVRFIPAMRPVTFLAANDLGDFNTFSVFAKDMVQRTMIGTARTNFLEFDYTRNADSIRGYIARAFNGDYMFFNYLGHGSPNVWSQSRIWRTQDIDSLLRPSSIPLIFTAVACSQNFDNPRQPQLVEKLLTFPNGGAVASLASSGVTYLYNGVIMVQPFYQEIFAGNAERTATIGELIWSIKRQINQSQDNCRLTQRYALLGDPALRLPTFVTTSVQHATLLKPSATVIPQPFSGEGTITVPITKSGVVKLECINIFGQLVFAHEEQVSAGDCTISLRLSNSPAGTYFYRIALDGVLSYQGKFALIR